MSKYILRTKSIESPTNSSDGIRVCVMRRIKPEYKFDIWIPVLGPSAGLLKKYVIDKSIRWSEFKKIYIKQLVRKQKFIKIILQLLLESPVTLLCVEKKALRCHRLLLANECKKLRANLKIAHR